MLDLSTHFWKSWEKVVLRGWRHPRSHLCHRCLQPLKTTFSKSVWKCSRGVLKWSKPLFKVFLAVLDLLQHFWTVFEGFRLMSCNRAGYGSRSENTPPKNFGRQTWQYKETTTDFVCAGWLLYLWFSIFFQIHLCNYTTLIFLQISSMLSKADSLSFFLAQLL